MSVLSGKKTYIIAAVMGLVTAVHQLGYIDASLYTTLMGFLGSGGLATLRAGVSK